MRGLLRSGGSTTGQGAEWQAGLVSTGQVSDVVEHLRLGMPSNLLLLDLAAAVERPGNAAELQPLLIAARRESRLEGVASLRPSIVMDARMPPEAVEPLAPHFRAVQSGLVKSPFPLVTSLWEKLYGMGRRALIDRRETAFALRRDDYRPAAAPSGARLRAADNGDLEALVTAARASLREEDRPDPFLGDPVGFRRWVRGRLHRARVVEVAGRAVFVGYADVRRSEGWLIQGVYTAPSMRRRGYAAAGMSALAEEAFGAGADHVQLAVVDGNEAAIRLYEQLGFEPFDQLRTILFL